MSTRTISFSVAPVHKKLLLSCTITFLGAFLCFALFYLLSDYNSLKSWFLSLGSCFYRQEEWTTRFFTPAVKQSGNLFSLLGSIISVMGMVLLSIRWKASNNTNAYTFQVNKSRMPWYVAVFLLALAAGIWEWILMLPANDEVFSAVNCAELHPFRIVSYYMLPNNHVYFNLLNRLLFGYFGDLVHSGRAMSLLAYSGVLLSVYYFLTRVISNNFFAFIALLPVAFQFHTLGFAAQARGYESQLLCGWLSLIAMLAFAIHRQNTFLLLNTVFNIAGFLLIPSYLYFYAAQILFLVFVMIAEGRIALVYFRQQLLLAGAVFLGYLPGLCFSGLSAYSDNKWVKSGTDTFPDYVPKFADSFMEFISDCFSGIGSNGGVANYVVFLLPLLLLFAKRKVHKMVGLFYIALWAAYILYSFVIKRTPFHRTLIIHFSLTVAFCVYSFYVITERTTRLVANHHLRNVVYQLLFILPLLVYSAYLFRFNRDNVSWLLYGSDVNGTGNAVLTGVGKIPKGSTISFTDDAFYHFYYSRKLGYKTTRCPDDATQYFIKLLDKPFPAAIGHGYELMADGGDDYEIYKKR